MPTRCFNDEATRIAIQISVQLDGGPQWVGSGFFTQASKKLDEGATTDCLLLISNKHVLANGAGNQWITLNKRDPDGQIQFGEQEQLAIGSSTDRYTGHQDPEIDLACIDLRGINTQGYDIPKLPQSMLGELDETRFGVGSDVLYAGFPNGMKDRRNGLALMRKGCIASAPSMDCQEKGQIAIDGTVLPGNSGCPVFVDYGDRYFLLGVMKAMSLEADDFGFAIKQKYVRQLIEDATEKSANELRAKANALIRESLEAGQLKAEVESTSAAIWCEIATALDQQRQG